MATLCPIECFKDDPPDFLSKHSTFVLTFGSLISGGIALILTYFLKSRCTTLEICCIKCQREPVHLSPEQVEVSPA